jgi:hypothetical protein
MVKMIRKSIPCAVVMAAVLLGGGLPAHNTAAAVVINEFMASNGTVRADEDGDFEDWIELFNTSEAPVDLSGWGLSDDDANPFKWRFPEGTGIQGGGFLLVWASGKDRHPEQGQALPGILREVWMGIPGTSVSDLTGHPDFPDNPTSWNRVMDYFEAPTNIADQYGQRMHAILVAPQSGAYRFWIASDDNGALELSTDENPANRVRIAHVPDWTSPRQWNKFTSQASDPIQLEAGGRYYISALMKEHGGGDNLAARWRRPDGTIEEPIPAHYFESFTAGELHTNFRIASDGEPLRLTRPNGETADAVAPVYVPRDVSYGRQPDGGGAWHYFGLATPGGANTSAPMTLPPAVTFSEPRGFKTAPFEVHLASSDPSAVIRYTLDGSEPGPESTVYSQPLLITGTTTLRASILEPGMIQLPPATVTYLFLEEVLQQGASTPPGWPSDREINNHRMEYGMRQQIVAGDNARLRAGLTAIPSISLVTDLAHLFDPVTGIYANSNRSHGWERPVSVELIDPVRGEPGEFQIDAGLRLRGAYSRSVNNPKHAFRLLFRSAYGENRLRFPLFEEEGVSEFHRVDLRTSQNYSWAFESSNNNTFLREVFSRDSQRDMGMPYTRSRYYHLYLNGQYWGLYMTQERGGAYFAASYLEGDREDWDCIKTSQPGYVTQASDGNFNAFYELHDIAINQGFTGANANNYWRVRGLNADGTANPDYPVYLDQDNLITYMLVSHYTGDPDSPVSIWGGFPNNMYALFNRADPTGFKWLRHDAEHSLGAHGGYGVNTDTTLAGTGAGFTNRSHFNPAILHARLMQHPEYRMRFADLAQQHLYRDGALTPENAKARVQSRMAEIDLAIIGESARWGRGRTRDGTWLPAANAVLAYLDQRRDILVGHYRTHGWLPGIDAPRFALVDGGVRISSDAPFYYTTDGSDPRLPGGGVHPSAVLVSHGGEVAEPVTLAPRGATWRYFDHGTEPPRVDGRAWLDPEYPDDDWNSGPAVLGFAGASVANAVATVTRRWVSGNSGPQVTTTYFRHLFQVDSVADVSGLVMEILRDDGAIVYLNGVELLRENMPSGPVTYDTFSSAIVGSPDQNTYFRRQSDAARLLRPGANVLAVEVHQCNATSSDLYFDFSLTTAVSGNHDVELPLHMGIALKARAFAGDEWSALAGTSTLGYLPEGITIHQWDFEHPAEYLSPSFSLGGGTLTVLPGEASEALRNSAAQGFDSAHLRLNDPLGATLRLALPTTGFEQIKIAYETRRSGQGAGWQTLEYTTDGVTWTEHSRYAVENADPQHRSFSLANVESANHNPDFAVRISFAPGAGGTDGNNRFDNITLSGVTLHDLQMPPEFHLVQFEWMDTGGLNLWFDVRAADGAELILETSADLDTWSEAGRVTGTGLASPVELMVSVDAGVPMGFWRLRLGPSGG